MSGIKATVKDDCLVITLPFRVVMEPANDALLKFTKQERKTLSWLMKGLSNKEIAAKMSLTERTVKYHVSTILAKLGLRSRVDVVRYFHEIAPTDLTNAEETETE